MTSPVSQVVALARVPRAVVGDIRAIAESAMCLTAIDRNLLSLLAELRVVGGEITRVRSVVEPQSERVSQIESTIQTMDRRTAVIERTLLDLKEKVDAATELLPDPEKSSRGALGKAKDAIAGS